MLKILSLFLCLFSFNAYGGNSVEKLNKVLATMNAGEKSLYQQASSQLRCPTCTGLSVLESEAMFSLQIRTKVAELAKSGKSYEQVMSFFESRYGIWIFRKPPVQGFHIFAWLGPIVALLLGLFVLWWMFWRKKSTKYSASKEIENKFQQELSYYKDSRSN
jgi:cytochrome c-type biogenesis protein CcmH/NrfF